MTEKESSSSGLNKSGKESGLSYLTSSRRKKEMESSNILNKPFKIHFSLFQGLKRAKEAQSQIRALLNTCLKSVSMYGRTPRFILNQFPELLRFRWRYAKSLCSTVCNSRSNELGGRRKRPRGRESEGMPRSWVARLKMSVNLTQFSIVMITRFPTTVLAFDQDHHMANLCLQIATD
jgi:hypothetical protein